MAHDAPVERARRAGVTNRSDWPGVVLRRGSLDDLGRLVRDRAPAARYVVVSDSTVAPLHGRPAVDALRARGLAADLVTIPPGEASKTPATWAGLLEEMARLGLGRDGCVVAVGGGVTGDIAGFAAATFARGVSLVQVPTTLLAMVDAALGGKTGIDLAAGKNLVGAFHPPALVVIDPATLGTLGDDGLVDGLAEVVKHGAIAERAYLDWVGDRAADILGRQDDALHHLIARSVHIKLAVVGRDAREAGERAVLNFGHTMGHALEHATGYTLRHGHAVALGMVAEASMGEALGVSAPGTADRLRQVLKACRLPTGYPAEPGARALLASARLDKKARAGTTRYVLLSRPGEVARTPDGEWTHAVPDDVAMAVLDDLRGSSEMASERRQP